MSCCILLTPVTSCSEYWISILSITCKIIPCCRVPCNGVNFSTSDHLCDYREITGKELRDAILVADDKVGTEVLDYCICWAFDVLKSENATYPKATKDVIKKLQSSAIPLL